MAILYHQTYVVYTNFMYLSARDLRLIVIHNTVLKCHSGWKNEVIKCGKYNKLVVIQNEDFNFNFATIVKEYLKSEEVSINNQAWLFIVLGVLAIIGFAFIAIREFFQAKSYWKHYVKSRENILELMILIGGLGYFISLMINPLYSIHFGAWTGVPAKRHYRKRHSRKRHLTKGGAFFTGAFFCCAFSVVPFSRVILGQSYYPGLK